MKLARTFVASVALGGGILFFSASAASAQETPEFRQPIGMSQVLQPQLDLLNALNPFRLFL